MRLSKDEPLAQSLVNAIRTGDVETVNDFTWLKKEGAKERATDPA